MTTVEILALVVTLVGVVSFAAVITVLYKSYANSQIDEIASGRRDAEIVNDVVAHICEVNIKADEENGNCDVNPHKLFESEELFEVENAEKLLGEASSDRGLNIVTFVEEEQGNYAEEDNKDCIEIS